MVTITRIIRQISAPLRGVLAVALALTFSLLPIAGIVPAQASGDGVSALHTMKPLDRTTPNTIITQADGTESAFDTLTGRPMLVNFWASWCAPCVHELPDLAVLDQALSDVGMGVMLVGLDRKGNIFGENFLNDKNIVVSSRVYDPSGDLPRILDIKVMPTSFLITADGRMIGRIDGPLDWAAPDVIAAVTAALTP